MSIRHTVKLANIRCPRTPRPRNARDNDMRMPALLLLQLLPFVEATSSNVSFVPGAILQRRRPGEPRAFAASGQAPSYVRVGVAALASRDATAPHGWVGYDIDMIVAVAEFLGFTFEIHEAQQLTGETYTETLIRTANDVDLWLSWWLRDKYRMNFTIMLAGHVDASPTLIRPPLKEAKASESFVKSLTTFYLPFSYPLWGCLIAMIFASGLVDNLLEKHNGGRLTASFFEYFAGVLWGGFHDPITRISALYQLANAFIILIIVSAYIQPTWHPYSPWRASRSLHLTHWKASSLCASPRVLLVRTASNRPMRRCIAHYVIRVILQGTRTSRQR